LPEFSIHQAFTATHFQAENETGSSTVPGEGLF
jgi:hypothetical protein